MAAWIVYQCWLLGLWSQGTTLPSSSPAVNQVRWWDICRTRPSQSVDFTEFFHKASWSQNLQMCKLCSVRHKKLDRRYWSLDWDGIEDYLWCREPWQLKSWMLKGRWPNRWFCILRLVSLACPMQGSRWVTQESLNIGHSKKMMKKLSKGDRIKLPMLWHGCVQFVVWLEKCKLLMANIKDFRCRQPGLFSMLWHITNQKLQRAPTIWNAVVQQIWVLWDWSIIRSSVKVPFLLFHHPSTFI